eukprot:CAMPEP_0119519518 /NCGR_PEP_ID=MMETSP1344-20130328/35801_1 /TAXON_ID=236787 /ORGANISM="Florenciella parvula, Strain CCMP2471" /LENGTH=33 /DNA_ID= /DNA_START= /DNA_END= /DNA_ORIENTATION=
MALTVSRIVSSARSPAPRSFAALAAASSHEWRT